MNRTPSEERTRQDTLGDRMKSYEAVETERRLMWGLPALARVDGRAFHAFTRGMDRPFDERFSRCMISTAAFLAQETNALLAYTQSDEITLAWHTTDSKSEPWFGGRLQKMVSQMGSMATLAFYREVVQTMPEYADREPTFDARIWNVPSLEEAANVFLWREWDASKNSISMAAQSVFSHRELMHKNGNRKQEMLFQRGINWNDYPVHFKRGTFIQRRTVAKPFTAEEINKLPAMHDARYNPDLLVERSVWEAVELPPLGTVKDRVPVLFPAP